LHRGTLNDDGWQGRDEIRKAPKGRWPANLLLNEDAAAMLVPASRFFYCAKSSSKERDEGLEGFSDLECGSLSGRHDGGLGKIPIGKNNHPTVKPLALMRYLITLISPPTNALILDPFAGSGSTIVAAEQLHINAIGIEMCPEYAEIARARVLSAANKTNECAEQLSLF
jgi:site-specific DNA-methyltransferase (adenine-specific)